MIFCLRGHCKIRLPSAPSWIYEKNKKENGWKGKIKNIKRKRMKMSSLCAKSSSDYGAVVGWPVDTASIETQTLVDRSLLQHPMSSSSLS